MVGAACFLFLFNLLYALGAFLVGLPALPAVAAAGVYLGTLVVARRASSAGPPAMLLVASLSLVLTSAIFTSKLPTASMHAITMLLPALAVYLGGARLGLFITLLMFVLLGVCYPLYLTRGDAPLDMGITAEQLRFGHLCAGFSFLGAWGLGALHNVSRHAAQSTLERTLKELRESERKLVSLIESTDDPMFSLDAEGRVLTANSTVKQLYRMRFGKELETGMQFFDPSKPEFRERWKPHVAEALQGRRVRFEEQAQNEASSLMDMSLNPIFGEGGRVVGMTFLGRDVTARREAEARLEELHRTLVDVSRQAGMAEVATGVLHNVGNTLNSVNVSTSLVLDQLRKSRLSGLAKAAALLREHTANFGAFLTGDPQGQKLPAYLIALSDQLQEERETMIQEMHALSESVEHIKSIILMQQKYARSVGTVEQVAVPRLIEEALRLHAVSLERLGIRIEQDYALVPPILVDRHKLLQILINLLSNARHALVESPKPDKRLRIRVRFASEEERLLIEVADNGVGIAPEHLPRLFTQGFTTKKTGHGFGLHISALAASEMGGRLSGTSAGPGLGATFTLELPLEGDVAHERDEPQARAPSQSSTS
jgi:PAS domain S-box-containing protein